MLPTLDPRSLILILVVVTLVTMACGKQELREQAAEKLQAAAEKLAGEAKDTSTPPAERSSAAARDATAPPPSTTSLPDLTVDLTVPATANAGDVIGSSMTVVVNNIGAATAPGKLAPGTPSTGFGTDVYIASTTTPPSSQPVYNANYSEYVLLGGGRANNTTDLTAGNSADYSGQLSPSAIPADTPDGSYYICAWVDPGELVSELDESNNITCQTITIGTGVVSGNFDLGLASSCAVANPAYDVFTQSVVVAVTRHSGHSSTVTFSYTAIPDITGTFSPSSLSGSSDGTSVLTLTVGSSLPLGDYSVTIQATDGVNTNTQSVTLTLLDFSAGSGLSFTKSTVAGGGTDEMGFTLAVESDGSVQSWGSNGFGELGNNDFGTGSDVPVDVLGPDGSTGLQDIVAVAAGRTHALALRGDGTVWSWGYASWGQLGIGGVGFSGTDPNGNGIGYVPFAVPVCGLTDIVAIAAGDSHSLALDDTGQAYSFGNNQWGQLGDGSGTHQYEPVEVMTNSTDSFSDVAMIGAGHFHALAVDISGNAYAWGRNEYGALGNLNQGTDEEYPVEVVDSGGSPLTGIVDIDGGYQHSLALDSSGAVYAWGDNYWGQLADSSMNVTLAHAQQTRDYSAEVTAVSSYTVTDIDAGADHSLVLTSGGEVLGFGWGSLGQNGDGNATERDFTPVTAVFPSTTVDPVKVSALGSHSVVLSENSSGADGTVYTFGDDREGQLGIGGASGSCGSGACETTPVEVTAATQVMLP